MESWKGKRVLVIGAARQGLALTRYLSTHGAQVTLNDQQSAEELSDAVHSLNGLPVEWAFGGHSLNLLDRVDLVCTSGGVSLSLPLVREARDRGMPLSNDSQVFMDAVRCPVIGITGSAGKTTTTTLIGRIANAAYPIDGSSKSIRKVWVGGNIGLPLINFVDEIHTDDLAIVELSSFQLELMTRSPWIAAILNITPNHLDRHDSMVAYTAAKARILAFQGSDDWAVLGRDNPASWSFSDQIIGRLVSFGLHDPKNNQDATFIKDETIYLQTGGTKVPLMPQNSVSLKGEHNLQNVLASCALAHAAGLPIPSMRSGIEGFSGVPHRLQCVRTWAGVDWYNDSIATAPERTIAAIHSFDEPLVLLLGGRDKKLPWDDLAALIHERVDHLIVFGEAAGKILQAVGPAASDGRPYTIERCSSLHTAVSAAAAIIQPGDVVLLSPGGTSFDEFRDFEERGEGFEKWVKELL